MPNVNHNPFPNLAGNRDLGSFEPIALFAGEKEIVTESFVVGADLAQYQVFALNASNAAVPLNPAASDGTEKAVGVTTVPVKLAAGGKVPAYTSAFLNHAVLIWPAALDTFEKRRAAFRGTGINIGTVI
ncbi:putative head decoration protein [Aeromonas phage AVP3]|nr:decorator protein [Aeromonas phage BUCT552]